MRYLKYSLLSLITLIILSGLSFPFLAKAQEILPEKTEIVKAQVLEIKDEGTTNIPELNIPQIKQQVTVKILSGEQKDKTVSFLNDYIELKKGEIFYLNHTVDPGSGLEFYSVQDAYRLPVLYFFIALFVILVLLIGGLQGLRGLLSLAGSFLLIAFVLLPGIMHGFSPILVSIGVASLIIILGSYVTHGFNKTTSSAVIGMIVTVIFTGIMAYVAVHVSNFSGYDNEEAMYLNLNARGQIDLIGILIGGMMIGFLGVLYDVAIGQAISVEELHHIAPHIERKTIFKRAIRIGREHIGALVNTLAIAYVGAFLPLLLLFSTPPVDVGMILNRELFATEVLRILIGSIGLVLAVPITTFLSVYMLIKKDGKNLPKETIEKEKVALEHFEHKH
jgi:uncharacterized membrane protein